MSYDMPKPLGDAAAQFTISAPSAATAGNTLTPTLPEWIRLPKPGTLCSWTGLSRSKLCELLLSCEANGHRPPVRSACLRRPGRQKGVRLIELASLLAYIDAHAEGGER